MIRNLLVSTFLSIRSHKFRVFLTMLGIIIGISSVVTIAALGEGVRQQTVQLMDSANANEIKIKYEMPITEENMYYGESDFTFSRADMKRIQKLDGVVSVLPDYGEDWGTGSSVEIIGNEFTYFGQYGYLQLSPFVKESSLLYGRDIKPSDANRDVIVLSHEVFDYGVMMENPEDLIGQAISISGYMYEVIGIKAPYDWEAVSLNLGGEDDYISSMTSIISRSSYNELTQSKAINALKIKFDESTDRFTTSEAVVSSLTENYPDEEGIFQEDRMNEEMQMEMENYMSGIVNFLMAITAISLLVGGIGVMNIMYVSVTERKREIGIRRAIGAKPRSILFQFVIEAAFITLIGGILGLLFGYGIAVVIGKYQDLTPVLTLRTMLIATSVSIFTGLFFGIMPAISAARMDPIKAIYR